MIATLVSEAQRLSLLSGQPSCGRRASPQWELRSGRRREEGFSERSHFAEAEGLAGDRCEGAAEWQAGHRIRRCRPRAPAGASDTEIHDAVLIAAAFCMLTVTSTGWRPSRRRDEESLRPDGSAHGQRRIPARPRRRWLHIILPDGLPGIRDEWPSGPRPPDRSTSSSTSCCRVRTRSRVASES